MCYHLALSCAQTVASFDLGLCYIHYIIKLPLH